jgi:hypothetical protein
MRATPAPVIADRDALPDAMVVAPAELAVAFGLSRAHRPRGAGVMTRRAAEQLAGDPSGDDVRTLEPIYLRAPRGVTTVSEGQVTWL